MGNPCHSLLVRSCVTRLAYALPNPAISFWNLFDSMVGSILDSLGKRGEQAQLYFHRALSSCMYFCFEADELIGSGVPLRKLGRSATRLVLSAVVAWYHAS